MASRLETRITQADELHWTILRFPHLPQLFRRLLKRCLTIKLQKCSVKLCLNFHQHVGGWMMTAFSFLGQLFCCDPLFNSTSLGSLFLLFFYSHGQQNMQKNLNDSHHKYVKYHHENKTRFYVERYGGNGEVTFLSYLFISELCFDPFKWCLAKTAVLFHPNVFCSTFIGLSRTRANFVVPLWQFSVLLCSLCFHTKAQQIRNGIITVGGNM